MKYLKHILTGIALFTALGCGSNPEPKPPVQPIEHTDQTPRRADLLPNWFEVTRDNWSYGLPMGFDVVNQTANFGVLVQHHSVVNQIDVSFRTHKTDMQDLHQYVLADFIMPSMISGKQVIATGENRKDPENVVLAVQLLYQGVNLSQDRVRKGAIYDSSLDFFVLKEKTVYHMSCFGEANALKASSEICFKAISSLRIK